MVGVLCKDAVSALLKGERETRVAITVTTSVKILHERRQSSNVLDKIKNARVSVHYDWFRPIYHLKCALFPWEATGKLHHMTTERNVRKFCMALNLDQTQCPMVRSASRGSSAAGT